MMTNFNKPSMQHNGITLTGKELVEKIRAKAAIQLNIQTNPEDVKIALELMGDLRKGDNGTYSFAQAVIRAKQCKESCIYGSGGFHRYWVRSNGTVEFSKFHCCFPDKCKDAQDLGFIIR